MCFTRGVSSSNKKIIYTRDEFYVACAPIFNKIKEPTESLNATYDSVEFIGGSSRIPRVQEIVTGILGNISRSLNQDETVLYGATFLAAMMKNLQRSEMTLVSINDLKVNISLGDETKVLVAECSPSTKTRTARFENRGATSITVYYGGVAPVGCSRLIGEYSISEKVAKSGGRLTIIFFVDRNGMLQLSNYLC